MNQHLQFLWTNLDKLLLMILLIILIGVHVHMVGALGNSVDPSEANQLNWIEGIIGQVLAALLTLFVTQSRLTSTTQVKEEVHVAEAGQEKAKSS